MRLISWNVNGRTKLLPEQVEVLTGLNCDFIALQEVRQNTALVFRASFQDYGLYYGADSFESVGDRSVLRGPRQYGQLIASRWPIQVLPTQASAIPWPETVLSTDIQTPAGLIELHTAHIPPGSSNGWMKIEVLEGIYKRLAVATTTLRILCGDFNAPKEEKPDGSIVTWDPREPRWDAGERNVLQGLANFGLVDAFRYQHGYRAQEFSWYTRSKVGRRFDHVFATPALLNRADCRYLHAVREQRLSDHSAIVFDFDPPTSMQQGAS
jgi:exonuclease III